MSKGMDIYAELDNFVEENEGQVTLTDVAKHFAEYGYQYAVEKIFKCIEDQAIFGWIEDIEVDKFLERIRKAMEE